MLNVSGTAAPSVPSPASAPGTAGTLSDDQRNTLFQFARSVKSTDNSSARAQHVAANLPGLVNAPVGGQAKIYGKGLVVGSSDLDVTVSSEGQRREMVHSSLAKATDNVHELTRWLEKSHERVTKADAEVGTKVGDAISKLRELGERGGRLGDRTRNGTIDAATGAELVSYAADTKAAIEQVDGLATSVKERTGVGEIPAAPLWTPLNIGLGIVGGAALLGVIAFGVSMIRA